MFIERDPAPWKRTAGGRVALILSFLLLFTWHAPAAAQRPGEAPPEPGDTVLYHLPGVEVTATRTTRPVFVTPAPVSVFDQARIRIVQPTTVGDLFREQPGLDVTGIGAQQPRPMIRGQRGHRILLLQDALRLNNSRRQQDFGEIPALVDISTLERIEVVRGPASVLYGTDAIGGVVNLITRTPTEEGIRGSVGYRYGSEADHHRGSASVLGRLGAFDFKFGASLRQAGDYAAPAGSFGDITLAAPAIVHGTGIEERSFDARVGYQLNPIHGVFFRAERYEGRNAGFGYVEPAAYAPSLPVIDIRYPNQLFQKITAGYSASGLRTLLADRANVAAYWQDNQRDFFFDLFTPIPAPAPPGSGVHVDQRNFSDVSTLGMRLEAKKLASPSLLLTYGLDFFRDHATSSDSTTTTVSGFGPQRVTIDTRPQLPDATYRSMGAFLQGEVMLGRLTLVLGTRAQDVRAEAEAIDDAGETVHPKANRTVVGSANAIYALTESLNLVGTVGRGFRSPNLIEWFFEGRSTDGSAYQLRNPELEPETSVNVDLGLRFRNRYLSVEGFAFRNQIANGIRTVPTGETLNQLPVYQNVNIEELSYRGVELAGDLFLPRGFTLAGSYTWLDAENVSDPAIPVGDLLSSRVTGALRYQHPRNLFWTEYGVRHNGEQTETLLLSNPVGEVLPAFTVHHLRGGVTVFRRADHVQRVSFAVNNLTDQLYAEPSNVSFFRPEPRRHLVLSWEASF